MSNINTSILPVIKSEWQSQLNALNTANKDVQTKVDLIRGQIKENFALESTLKPQLEQAQLAQWQAQLKYNSFIESGRQLLQVAADAERRLQSDNLSLLERSQLASTRDNMINLASEFITFKTQNSASLHILPKMDIGSKTYYSDGRVEWNTGTAGGLAGQIWDDAKEVAAGIKNALLKGPFTTEENFAACQSALSALLPKLAGKILKNPGAGIPDVAYGEVLSNAINAADPAAAMCRRVYPKGQSPQELWRLGQVIEGTDPAYGDFTVVLIAPEKLANAALYNAFTDPQVQGLWSSQQAGQVVKALTGNDVAPFLDVPQSLAAFSALAPVWANPQWGIQLASAGSIQSDAGNGLSLENGWSDVYGLADGHLMARQAPDGAGVLLGNSHTDTLRFGAGSRLEVSGLGIKVTSNGQTITRNWLADDVHQTKTYGSDGTNTNTNTNPISQSLNFGPVSYNLLDLNQRSDAEYRLNALRSGAGEGLNLSAWNDFTADSTRQLLGGGSGLTPGGGSYGLQPPAGWLDPIGAFYDSQSAAFDNAASIANKTTRAMNASGQSLTGAQLAALDTNADGQISTAEAAPMRLWADLNENGAVDYGELQSVGSAIKADDYSFYTRGNGQAAGARLSAPAVVSVGGAGTRPQAPSAIAPSYSAFSVSTAPGTSATAVASAPATPTPASLPGSSTFTPVSLPSAPAYGGVPDSNYRTLRDTDSRYWVNGVNWIDFAASQVKINNSNRSYLIGTDGNDNFDSSYYASYSQYFNSGLLTNFLAGGGNDVKSCDPANDNDWSMAA